MARRATYFLDIFQPASQALRISGAWEFVPPNDAPPSDSDLTALAKAYDFMQYDIGHLAAREAEILESKGLTPDATRKTAAQEPVALLHTKQNDSIGVVRFPSLPEGTNAPSRALIERVTQLITQTRSQSKLVIALSDWGWIGEREYLAQDLEYVPDLLLGSGHGSGVDGRVESNGRCIWVRTYDKGRTVSEVQVMAWPDRTKPFVWKEPDNFNCLTMGLGDKFTDNPDVSALFQ